MDRQNHAGGCLYKAVVEAARQREARVGRRMRLGGGEMEMLESERIEREEGIYGTTFTYDSFFLFFSLKWEF